MNSDRLRRWAGLTSVFFAASACSWMPHWSCHYYRLETGSTFVVGTFVFSATASLVAMGLYGILIAANLIAVAVSTVRPAVAIASGLLHLLFAGLHGYRLYQPFRFEVLGYPWSSTASLREVAIVGAFGIASVVIGFRHTPRINARALR